MSSASLTRLDADLWVASRPLRMWVGDIGARMTVIRLRGGELLLHSPIALDAPTRDAVDALGRVRWLIGPSKVHHLFLGDWARGHPSAQVCGAPGLAEKRKDLGFSRGLDEALREEWRGQVEFRLFEGAPGINEVVFFHPSSRTLVLTDLAFNVRRGSSDRAKLFHRLVGATGRFGPHRILRLAIRNRELARRSLDEILKWDFDRIVVSHGEVLERGGRAALEASFAFLRAGAAAR